MSPTNWLDTMAQFDDVSSMRGAPMGRRSYGQAPAKGVHLFKVKLVDGCYDDGGAYWGAPANLWCARSDDYRAFTRASCREEAMSNLGLSPKQVRRG